MRAGWSKNDKTEVMHLTMSIISSRPVIVTCPDFVSVKQVEVRKPLGKHEELQTHIHINPLINKDCSKSKNLNLRESRWSSNSLRFYLIYQTGYFFST